MENSLVVLHLKTRIYQINHVSAEILTTGRMIPQGPVTTSSYDYHNIKIGRRQRKQKQSRESGNIGYTERRQRRQKHKTEK